MYRLSLGLALTLAACLLPTAAWGRVDHNSEIQDTDGHNAAYVLEGSRPNWTVYNYTSNKSRLMGRLVPVSGKRWRVLGPSQNTVGWVRQQSPNRWVLSLGQRRVGALVRAGQRWRVLLTDGTWVGLATRSQGSSKGFTSGAAAGAALLVLVAPRYNTPVYGLDDGGEPFAPPKLGSIRLSGPGRYTIFDSANTEAGIMRRLGSNSWAVYHANGDLLGYVDQANSGWQIRLEGDLAGFVSQTGRDANYSWTVRSRSRTLGYVDTAAGAGEVAAGGATVLLVYPAQGGSLLQQGSEIGRVRPLEPGRYQVQDATGNLRGELRRISEGRWQAYDQSDRPLGQLRRQKSSRWTVVDSYLYADATGSGWAIKRGSSILSNCTAGSGAAALGAALMLGQ